MNYLIFILVSFSVMASNWVPLSKIQSQSSQAYQLESECLKSGEQCLDVGDEPEIVALGFASVQNDWGPEISPEECSGEEDCQSKLQAKECSEPLQKFISQDLSRVYCVQLIGKKLSVDQAGYNAYKAQKAQKAALEAGIQVAQNLRSCGERVMALMLVRNQPKGLSTGQVKQLVATYSPIKELLESGSLVSAKEEIANVVADGTLVTEADKAALTAEINKCLGL